MPKISGYTDLGTPQGEEQLIIARGANTRRLTWSTIRDYLQLRYLGYGNGVTNGNSHAHISGAGAQIDHTTLSNIGTNTHAQIDSHISASVHGLLVDDSGNGPPLDGSYFRSNFLKFDAEAGVTYYVRGRIILYVASGEIVTFRFAQDEIGTSGKVKCTYYKSGVTTGTTSISTWNTEITFMSTANIFSLIEFDAKVLHTWTTGEVAFEFANDIGNLVGAFIYGSYWEYSPMD